MTCGQYSALCLIGGVAVVAYLQSLQVARRLQQMTGGSRAVNVVGGMF